LQGEIGKIEKKMEGGAKGEGLRTQECVLRQGREGGGEERNLGTSREKPGIARGDVISRELGVCLLKKTVPRR